MLSPTDQADTDPGKYHISLDRSQGVVIGDNARVEQYFHLASPSPPFSRPDLPAAIHRANADLRTCHNTIAGIHLDRPEVDEIVAWAMGADANQRLGMLLDQPGGGKTVVMRDVLERLEAARVPLLAVKADNLSGVRTRSDLRDYLALSADVEECASQLAAEGTFVVLLDQLDALSLSLTRDQTTLALILSTLARLSDLENVRIVASCRTFDLHNDPRLSGIKPDRTFELRPLDDVAVNRVLQAIGVDPTRLLPAHYDLLRVPLHLDIYARTSAHHSPQTVIERFWSLQELYTALWRNKVESVIPESPLPAERYDAIYRLVDIMAATRMVNAPHAVLDDLTPAARYLEKEGLIRLEKARWTFLHQTFFDYCYARRFVAGSRLLSQEVLGGPQGLFERSQIVQVLSYLRGTDRSRYLRELTDLLSAPGLRVHLLRLIFGWLGALRDPQEDELALVRRWATDPDRRAQLLRSLSGNAAWFDLLDRDWLPRHMVTADGAPVDRAIYFMESVMKARTDAVLRRLRPNLGRDQNWDAAIAYCLSHLEDWRNDGAVDVLCDLLARGATFGREDLCLHNLASSNPAGGCRVLRVYLDYRLDSLLAKEGAAGDEKSDDSGPGVALRRDRFRWDRELLGEYAIGELMLQAVHAAPEALIDHLLSWWLRAIAVTGNDTPAESLHYCGDALFSWGWYEEHRSEGATFALRMAQALAAIARSNPVQFRSIANRLVETDWGTIHRMLAQAYLADPATYLDDILEYLVADRRRLFLGDMGDAHYESRCLYAAAFAQASAQQRLNLEALVLDRQPEWEERHLRSQGSLQLAFLTSVPNALLSERAQRRRRELERKFPGYRPPIPRGIEGGAVGPPIDPVAQEKMSDEAWLGAMRKYDDSTEWGAPNKEFLKGGVIELSRAFAEHIKQAPERFYRLAQRFDNQISLHYVTAAVSGLADSDAPADWIMDLVRRFAPRLEGEFRRNICWALRKRSEASIPDDILDLIADWAINDPDPAAELWQVPAAGGQPYYGGDPHQYGINTNRGAAVIAFVDCALQRKPPQSERAFRLLEKAATDSSIAVQTCVISVLGPLLNHDAKRAMDILERTTADQLELLASPLVYDFLYRCYRYQFARVKPFIEALLTSPDDAARQAGARLACLAAFHESEARPLAEQAITGDVAMRLGAAEVYARNLEQPETQAACEVNLRRLLDDPDEKVRSEVGQCFFHLRPEHLADLRPFIRVFLASQSLRSGAEHLIRYLKSVACDDYDLTLDATERILDEVGDSVLDIRTRWAVLEADLVQLPLAVYNHAIDPAIKGRAMDLFERLLVAGSRSAHGALAEWDRR